MRCHVSYLYIYLYYFIKIDKLCAFILIYLNLFLKRDRYDALQEPSKSLMTWLMDVLADACTYPSNKMSSRNFGILYLYYLFTFSLYIIYIFSLLFHDLVCNYFFKIAICVAPNLFTSTGTNPADSLFISGKVVHFVSQILGYRLKLKTNK